MNKFDKYKQDCIEQLKFSEECMLALIKDNKQFQQELDKYKLENKVLREGIKAYKKINLCYRLGGQPPEWVFKSIEKLDKFVKELQFISKK